MLELLITLFGAWAGAWVVLYAALSCGGYHVKIDRSTGDVHIEKTLLAAVGADRVEEEVDVDLSASEPGCAIPSTDEVKVAKEEHSQPDPGQVIPPPMDSSQDVEEEPSVQAEACVLPPSMNSLQVVEEQVVEDTEVDPDIFEAAERVKFKRRKLETQLRVWQKKLENANASRGKKRRKVNTTGHILNTIAELQVELKKADHLLHGWSNMLTRGHMLLLPDELLFDIFFRLGDLREVVRLGQACSRLNGVSKDISLWKKHVEEVSLLPFFVRAGSKISYSDREQELFALRVQEHFILMAMSIAILGNKPEELSRLLAKHKGQHRILRYLKFPPLKHCDTQVSDLLADYGNVQAIERKHKSLFPALVKSVYRLSKGGSYERGYEGYILVKCLNQLFAARNMEAICWKVEEFLSGKVGDSEEVEAVLALLQELSTKGYQSAKFRRLRGESGTEAFELIAPGTKAYYSGAEIKETIVRIAFQGSSRTRSHYPPHDMRWSNQDPEQAIEILRNHKCHLFEPAEG